MTGNQIDKARNEAQQVAAPGRVGQGTAVEQARAMAEVHAAMLIAREMPRDLASAIREMEMSCGQLALAERASYKFPRGGQNVAGPSVYLARELARCWGNIQYGITELRRDDEYGQSEMQAWAWDVQTNSRSSSTFIVPHKRDKRGGAERLTDMRDIYENNANNGARRLREAIFSVLPVWFVEQAKTMCAATLENGGGVPLAKRVSDAVAAFKARGVSKERLERKLGKPSNDWNAFDVADLGVTFASLQRGEITIADEFPEERVTAAEVTGNANAEATVAPPVSEPADPNYDDEAWKNGGAQS